MSSYSDNLAGNYRGISFGDRSNGLADYDAMIGTGIAHVVRPENSVRSGEKFMGMGLNTLSIKCMRAAQFAVQLFAALLLSLLLVSSASAQGTTDSGAPFNHNSTGFRLTDFHAQARCESCHIQGQFRGTPRDCASCHRQTGRASADLFPINHIPTALACDTCHRTSGWTPAYFTHQGVVAGTCANCHNGVMATGKPLTHVPTTAACDSCHKITAWIPAGFAHTGITIGDHSCATCHNGAKATGKPSNHIPTSAACDTCHMSFNTWVTQANPHSAIPAVATIGGGGCITCHNGANALGKPAFHIPTTSQCDTCHNNFIAFAPGIMNHPLAAGPAASLGTHNCATCHNGNFLSSNAQTKPPTHVATTAACDTCHQSTSTWATATFIHPPTAAGTCSNCHNNVAAIGKPTNHIPTSKQCDTCHNNFTAFAPAAMNHAGLAGQCSTCHNGSYVAINALAKPPTHIPNPSAAVSQCDTCHTNGFVAFAPAVMNHAGMAGFCDKCHNGSYLAINAQSKPPTHIQTTLQCDNSGCHASTTSWGVHANPHGAIPAIATIGDHTCATANCHSTPSTNAIGMSTNHIPTTGLASAFCDSCHTSFVAFAPAMMNHSLAGVANNCSTCHSGTYNAQNAQSKPATHLPTSAQCDSCHTTTAWLPTNFSHPGVVIGDHTCASSGCHATGSVNAVTMPSNHIPTTAACDNCHNNFVAFAPGVMSHTLTTGPLASLGNHNCATCHSGTYIAVNAQMKPTTHISTALACDNSGCHNSTTSWATAANPHGAVPPIATIGSGGCSTCHGVNALGKPTNHILTAAQCDTCHTNFVGFNPATMNHNGTAGQCASCHNGGYVAANALGKPANHIPTSAQCDTCHISGFVAFAPSSMNHTGTAGQCSTCHGGAYVAQNALTKPATHLVTTLQCDTCHNTSAWLPAVYSHTGVTPGTCATCHNGTTATGKNLGHIPTTSSCDVCHNNYVAFAPGVMNHAAAVGPVAALGGHNCATCHGGSYLAVNAQNQPPTHIATALACDSSGCHSSTTSWSTYANPHSTVPAIATIGAGGCTAAGCHGTANAIGKPTTHIPTTSMCDTCHKSFLSFAGTGQMNHPGTAGPAATIGTHSCDQCHNATYAAQNALAKPTSHVPISAQCDYCHTNFAAFAPAVMNHSTPPLTANSCSTCHNGTYSAVGAQGQPVTHLPTALQCNTCHSTTAWVPANGFSHQGVVITAPGCSTCHNGTAATGKSSGHIPTTADCNVCHANSAFTSFTPADTTTKIHTGMQGPAAAGNCITCHSGTYLSVNAQTKPATHITTSASCDSSGCHDAAHNSSYTTWAANPNPHSAVPAVAVIGDHSCDKAGCHGSTNAIGKPTNHIPTTGKCDTCHTNFTAFSPALTGNTLHTAMVGPAAVANCSTCHGGAYLAVNALAITAAHIPTSGQCDSCHTTSATASYTTWGAVMNHTTPATAGICSNCHNGTYTGEGTQYGGAQAKAASHFPTTAQCDSCHTKKTYTDWTGATYNHTGVAKGTCASCHIGYTAGGVTSLSSDHIPLNLPGMLAPTNECSNCHSTTQTNTGGFALGEKMAHGSMQGGTQATGCAVCHASTSKYNNGTAKTVTLGSHQGSKSTDDCSNSKCHKPLGKTGSPYSAWN